MRPTWFVSLCLILVENDHGSVKFDTYFLFSYDIDVNYSICSILYCSYAILNFFGKNDGM